jgi:hypothetical protein
MNATGVDISDVIKKNRSSILIDEQNTGSINGLTGKLVPDAYVHAYMY